MPLEIILLYIILPVNISPETILLEIMPLEIIGYWTGGRDILCHKIVMSSLIRDSQTLSTRLVVCERANHETIVFWPS